MNIKDASNILIIKSDRLGDIVLCSGYISALADALPNATIELWLSPDMYPAGALIHPKVTVRKLPFDRYLRGAGDEAIARDWIGELRDNGYNALVIPQFTLAIPECLALSYVSIETRHGFGNFEHDYIQQWLEVKFGKPLWSPQDQLHGPQVEQWSSEVSKYADLLKWQGIASSDCLPRLFVPQIDRTSDSSPGKILLWPGAAKDEFRWSERSFAELVTKLQLRSSIVVGGAIPEEQLVRNLLSLLQEQGITADMSLRKYDELTQTALWLREFELVLTNDTGIAHLAAALGCSVVSISGSLHQGRFVVRGRSALTIYADVPCKRCNGRCIFVDKPRPCIAQIKPDIVASALSRWKGIEGQLFLETTWFDDPSIIYPSIHKQVKQLENSCIEKQVVAESQRDHWEKTCHEAESQRDHWEKTCHEAESQRDHWEKTCHEAEFHRNAFSNILDDFYVLFPWMAENSVIRRSRAHPKISIITPSYNQGSFIEETIRSVLLQEYINFEHIVVDAGSNDQTVDVLRRYPHVRWVSEKDKGQAHAINKGILMSSGEIVAYLNSDDVYRPGAFQIVAQIFSDEPDTNIIVGNCDYIDEKSQKTGFLRAKYDGFEGLIRYWGWDKWFCIPQQSVFIRRSVFSEIGLFDIQYQMVMDYDMWLRIASQYPFRVVDRTLAAFRLMENTKTVSRTYLMYLEEINASKMHWKKLPWKDRAPVALSAYRHVGKKMLDVSEHYAFNHESKTLSLELMKVGVLKWPMLCLNPRTWFTVMQIIFFHSSKLLKHVRSVHRTYLTLTWRLQKIILKSMKDT